MKTAITNAKDVKAEGGVGQGTVEQEEGVKEVTSLDDLKNQVAEAQKLTGEFF